MMAGDSQSGLFVPRGGLSAWGKRHWDKVHWTGCVHVWFSGHLWIHCRSWLCQLVSIRNLKWLKSHIIYNQCLLHQVPMDSWFDGFQYVVILTNTISFDFLSRTRYFSKPRNGHNPLRGRAYYQLLECLGVSFTESSIFQNGWCTLIMANAVVRTSFQPTIFYIKGPWCRLQYFHHIENSVHLEDIQPRRKRWVY